MRGFIFIPLQALLLIVPIRARAATWLYTSMLTPGQFTGEGQVEISPVPVPDGDGVTGGQTGSNSGTNSVGGGQVLNNPEPLFAVGQATLYFDDATLAWSVSGTYGNFQGNILGVELFGAAAIGYSAPVATRYSFLLHNDGGLSGNFTGSGVFSPTQADDLQEGLLALSIQSSAGAQDSIRGQLAPVPEAGVPAFLMLTGLVVMSRRGVRQRAG